MGRKSTFTKAIGEKVCDLIAEGSTLREVCKKIKGLNPATIVKWTMAKANSDFGKQYARARQVAYGLLEDEIRDVNSEITRTNTQFGNPVDAASVQAAKLKADNLKWILSKRLPKDYGDNVGKEFQEPKAPIINITYAPEAPPARVVQAEKKKDDTASGGG